MSTEVKWKTDEPPYHEYVIVSVHDESGDNAYDYTTFGWKLNDCWIVDNDVNQYVVAWAELPKPYKQSHNSENNEKKETHAHWIKVVSEDDIPFPEDILFPNGKIPNFETLKDREYKCSNCGNRIVTNGIDRTDKCHIAKANNPYCRWCGARMDE